MTSNIWCLCIYLSTFLSMYKCIYCLSVYLSLFLSICLSLSISFSLSLSRSCSFTSSVSLFSSTFQSLLYRYINFFSIYVFTFSAMWHKKNAVTTYCLFLSVSVLLSHSLTLSLWLSLSLSLFLSNSFSFSVTFSPSSYLSLCQSLLLWSKCDTHYRYVQKHTSVLIITVSNFGTSPQVLEVD